MISVITMTRPVRVSRSPVSRKIRYIGTKTPTAGIILVDSIHINRSLVRLPGTKAIAQAAGMAITRARMVEPNDRITEFEKNRR